MYFFSAFFLPYGKYEEMLKLLPPQLWVKHSGIGILFVWELSNYIWNSTFEKWSFSLFATQEKWRKRFGAVLDNAKMRAGQR